MFDRLVERRWAVTAAVTDYWQLMEDTAPVLGSLKCATTVMSTETEVSISNTYPITFGLLNKHIVAVDGDSPKVAEFKSKVRDSLGERMKVCQLFITLIMNQTFWYFFNHISAVH